MLFSLGLDVEIRLRFIDPRSEPRMFLCILLTFGLYGDVWHFHAGRLWIKITAHVLL